MKRFLCLLLCALLCAGASAWASAEGELAPIRAIGVMHPATIDLNDYEFLSQLAANAGLDITYEIVTSDWNVKKSTLLASGDIPDFFVGDGCITENEISLNTEYFARLDELIAEYAPNIQAAIDNDETYRNLVTNVNGGIYHLASRYNFAPKTGTSLFINRTWLDALDLEAPTTIDELEAVLEAFKTRDPNGNGIEDELPLYLPGFSFDECWGIRGIAGMFDVILPRGEWFQVDDGELTFMPADDRFKEFIAWLADMKDKGYYDEELATAGWDIAINRWSADPCVIGITNLYSPSFNITFDNYESFALPEGPNGDRYVCENITFTYSSVPRFVLSAKCEHKDKVMKFIDQFFVQEIAVQANYGAIGLRLTDVDGVLHFIDCPEGEELDSYLNKYGLQFPFYTADDELMAMPANKVAKLALDEVNRPFVKPGASLPVLKFLDEENYELAMMSVDITTYMNKMIAEWIIGGKIDEQWDEYIETLNKMGLERYIEIHRQAYARIS